MSFRSSRPPRERDQDKRRVYQLILPLFTLVAWGVAVADVWLQLLSAFHGAVLAVAGVSLTVLSALVFFRRVRLQLIEWALLLLTIVVHALVLWYALYVGATGPLSLPAIAVFLWLPAYYLILFLAFPDRRALRYSYAVLLSVVALTLQAFLDAFHPGAEGQAVFVLIQVYLSQAVLIAALYFIAGFKRRFLHMEATADTMRRLANTDPLTQLGNRRWLERFLADEVHRSGRYRRPLSVILGDIDDFKRLNDRFGHPVGDRVLIDLGNRLEHSVRTADRVGRWGGEEFMIVTPETRLEDAVTLADTVRAHLFGSTLGHDHHLSVSFGVASYCAGDSVADLIERADAALYLAKSQGKNCVRSERDLAP